MTVGDNLEAYGLDIVPEPDYQQYRHAAHYVALNAEGREDARFLLQVLGYLPYPAMSSTRGGRQRPVMRECNSFFAQRRAVRAVSA